MSRVLSRRGLPRGRDSPAVSAAQLADAVVDLEANDDSVYVDLDAQGRVWCRGGCARASVRARLAANVHAATATLVAHHTHQQQEQQWRLRIAEDLPPHHELLLWFDEETLAAIDMPFLALRNIRSKKSYVCDECDAEFDEPNPLKVHMFLSCRPYSPRRFWTQFLARVSASPPASPRPAPTDSARLSAFRPYASVSPSATTSVPTPAPVTHLAQSPLCTQAIARLTLNPGAGPAQIEALATEWGRTRDGHLCLYCGKLYSRKYGLKIHIRTHTGYKPLRCRHCLRAFGDPSNLNKHVRLHAATGGGGGATSGASHACSLCGKALVRRRDLERHLRTRHAVSSPSPGACAVP